MIEIPLVHARILSNEEPNTDLDKLNFFEARLCHWYRVLLTMERTIYAFSDNYITETLMLALCASTLVLELTCDLEV